MTFHATIGNDYKEELETIRKEFPTREEALDFLIADIHAKMDNVENITTAGIDNLINGLKLTNRVRIGFDWWTIWVGV